MADGEIRIEIIGDARDFRRALAGVSDDIGRLQKQSFGLGDALKTAFSAAAGFLAANVIQNGLQALSGAIGGAVSKAAELENELNFLQAVSGATGEQMRKVAALAKQLGADVTIPAASALDAAKAMTELAKAGLNVEQSMAAAKGTLQLAAAGQLDAARAAEIVAGALNAFNLQGDQAVRVADLLAAAANASAADVTSMADSLKMASAVAAMSGRSIEETITALSMMANAGIQGSDAGTSLKTMLLRLVAPTDKAAEMMNELGIKLTDSKGKMLPLREIVGQFSRALSKLSEDQRNYTLATIFGTDAIRAANIILMAGVEAYDEMYKAVTKSNAAADLAAARMRGLKGAKEALNNAVETLGLAFGEKLLPALAKVIFSIADLLTEDRVIQFVEELGEKVGNWLAKSFETLSETVKRIDFSSLIATMRLVGEKIVNLLVKSFTMLRDVVKQIDFLALVAAIRVVSEKVSGVLVKAFALLRDVVKQIDFSALFSIARTVGEKVGELLAKGVAALKNAVGQIDFSPLIAIARVVGEKIGGLLAKGFAVVGDVVKRIDLSSLVSLAGVVGFKAGGMLAKGFLVLSEVVKQIDLSSLVAAARTAGEELGRMFMPLKDRIVETFALARDAVKQIDFSALLASLRMAGEELWSTFKPILDGIAALGVAIAPVLRDIGVQLQALIKQGFRVLGEVFAEIKPAAQDALSAIGELLSALAPHVQNVLKALSPLITQIGNALLTFARNFGTLIRDALTTLASFIRAITALLRGDMDGFVRYLADSVRNLSEMVGNAIRGAVETVSALIGVNLNGVLSFIERVNNALLSLRNFGLNVAQTVIENLNRIRLPFGIGGGQQQQTTQNVTNNYMLNVNAVSSQGVISDFEMMRRLGWR